MNRLPTAPGPKPGAVRYANGLTTLQFVDAGSDSVQTDADTGLCQIDRAFWAELLPAQRYFILLHEQAHLTQATQDELEADRVALLTWRTRYGHSPAAAHAVLNLMAQLLAASTPAQQARLAALQHQLYV
jgi:hypothetical protein